jgi:squalene-hopene/tetraprenyl-beta-curcumene cyclase
MALSAANKRGEYKTILDNATKFLRKLQWDEEEQKTPKDDFYGGAGYGGTERPDLSNTGMFLEALKAAGIPQDDPAFKKAAIFVSRCQNLKGEHNDQPWADKINDGSFIYTAAKGGETKVPGEHANGALPGYGSMTYTGVKSMIHCGIAKDDPRIKAAVAWMQKNYTLDANPGMPASHSQIGLYYGYHTLAKCFAALDVDTFTDAKGVQHDWRAELIAALAKRQRPDGSWVNEKDAQQWMEGDPHLVTGYALMALSYCKPKPR